MRLDSFVKLTVTSGSQEVFRLLWEPKVHYRVYKIPILVSILSQLKPKHTSYTIPKVIFNIILSYKPRFLYPFFLYLVSSFLPHLYIFIFGNTI
jgi:hypothetical protein